MTEEEAILFVRGMIKNCRGQYRDDEANRWAKDIGWYTILPEGSGDGAVKDYKEDDWAVDEDGLPALLAASSSDGAAYETATRLLCAYLRWARPMPDCLAKYAISRLLGQEQKPHRKKKRNQFRDEIASVAITYLKDRAGIEPDRTLTSDRLSGIEIVTDALRDAGYTATTEAIKSAYYRNK